MRAHRGDYNHIDIHRAECVYSARPNILIALEIIQTLIFRQYNSLQILSHILMECLIMKCSPKLLWWSPVSIIIYAEIVQLFLFSFDVFLSLCFSLPESFERKFHIVSNMWLANAFHLIKCIRTHFCVNIYFPWAIWHRWFLPISNFCLSKILFILFVIRCLTFKFHRCGFIILLHFPFFFWRCGHKKSQDWMLNQNVYESCWLMRCKIRTNSIK